MELTQVAPLDGFLRLQQIIGDNKATPPILPLIPVSRATWYRGIKAGIYPKGIRMSEGITVYRISDIRAVLYRIGSQG